MGDTTVRTGRREQGPFGGGTGQDGGHSPMKRQTNCTELPTMPWDPLTWDQLTETLNE